MVEKVISGAQRGADIAALRAAASLGIPTGGWMPAGYRTLDGQRPDYARTYNVRTTDTDRYPERTELNVISSDVTVRFAWDWCSRGELCTLRALERFDKPYLDVTITRGDPLDPRLEFDLIPDDVRSWLCGVNGGVRVLNVAGNASWWIEEDVEDFLVRVLRDGD